MLYENRKFSVPMKFNLLLFLTWTYYICQKEMINKMYIVRTVRGKHNAVHTYCCCYRYDIERLNNQCTYGNVVKWQSEKRYIYNLTAVLIFSLNF